MFFIEDGENSMHVAADDWGSASEAWFIHWAATVDDPCEIGDPESIHLVADEAEFITQD